MVVNYIEGVNVPLIEKKTLKYQEENAEQIMINCAKAEELSAALAVAKGLTLQADAYGVINQGSQSEFSSGTQGYAPTMAGGQPRPVGMAHQPVPPGTSLEMQGYDEEEMVRLRAEEGGRAGRWSVEFSRKSAIEETFGSLWI